MHALRVKNTCIHASSYIHTCIHTYIHTHTHKYAYIHTCTHTCTTYLNIHTHSHTCIHYTNIHTHTESAVRSRRRTTDNSNPLDRMLRGEGSGPEGYRRMMELKEREERAEIAKKIEIQMENGMCVCVLTCVYACVFLCDELWDVCV
jgi:hypothetical protein